MRIPTLRELSMAIILRRWILPLHRWTGFTVGIVVIFMATTGAGMVFRAQVDPAINGELLIVTACAPRLSLDNLAHSAQLAHPEGQLDSIHLFARPDAAAQLRFSTRNGKDIVYVNPCSGQILGQRGRYDGIFDRLEQLHRFKFMKRGSLITGISSLLFVLVLAGGGLVIWWPRTFRGLSRHVRPISGLTGMARMLNLHRIIGFYSVLVLLTSALTGLPLAFDWYRSGVYLLTDSPLPEPAPKTAIAAGPQSFSMEAAWQRAQSLTSNPDEVLLHYAHKPGDPIEVELLEQHAPNSSAFSYLYLDANTGRVLSYRPYATASAADRLLAWADALHRGEIGGLAGQLVLLAGALAVPVLGFTGFRAYFHRRLRLRNNHAKDDNRPRSA
ncbi:PepSY-associated TM helix domain-containing protein [Paraburkholderia youngii]|uniref:PepSY-associated TM helix domain-containing protein n=1 Tax=Paraburkholderia youngii TaxID=2782701 RepID=UPI003D25AE8B